MKATVKLNKDFELVIEGDTSMLKRSDNPKKEWIYSCADNDGKGFVIYIKKLPSQIKRNKPK